MKTKNEQKAELIKERENIRKNIEDIKKSLNDKLITGHPMAILEQKLTYASNKEKELTEKIRNI